jgi:hypothetical protein
MITDDTLRETLAGAKRDLADGFMADRYPQTFIVMICQELLDARKRIAELEKVIAELQSENNGLLLGDDT